LNIRCRLLCASSKTANLIGDNSKTTPLLTSTRGLNCCVECQQIRLLGDPSYNVKNF